MKTASIITAIFIVATIVLIKRYQKTFTTKQILISVIFDILLVWSVSLAVGAP